MAAPDSSHAPPQSVDSRSARLRFDAPEDLIGHTLNDRYKILEQLGSGGMGTVYLAEHVLINKQVAVKVLSPTHARKPDEVERFLREARAASRIRHENVVDITDFGYTAGGLAFLVMEYLDGEDLATTSQRDGKLPWRRALHITRQMCAALAAAHAQGIIHRDVKPENVFRVRRGDDPDFIKVLDFGIAKIIDENYDQEQPSHTGSGLMGTPEYVAPELIRGLKPDVRVDVYAVGVILYRLLAGRVPFAGDSFMATLTAHLLEEARPIREVAPDAEVPAGIEAVCLQSLAKDRDQRYATIREMMHALHIAEREAAGPVPLAAPAGRRLTPILAGLVALILIGAAVLWAYRTGRESAPELARAETPMVAPAVASDMSEKTGPKDQVVPPPEPRAATGDAAVEPAAVEPAAVEPAGSAGAPGDADAALTLGAPGSDEPGERAEPSRPGGPRAPLPERLSSIELAGGMRKLDARVARDCSRYAMRKMEVGLRVEVAASGKVKQATPTGLQSGALGACVAKVARTAKYRRAREGAEFVYTFRM